MVSLPPGACSDSSCQDTGTRYSSNLSNGTRINLFPLQETTTVLSIQSNPQKNSPYSINNVRRFIAFRLFFNARFYYPVFTILFLDFGLSLEQFAMLNFIWAITIVLMEVPSGALADIVGRKRLMVFSGVLMILEMGLISILPIGNSPWLFFALALNRILSGIAEASASGADEALAYDSLVAAGLKDQWGLVLERLMRIQSLGFITAMSIGAAIYDPALMQKCVDLFKIDLELTQATTLRFPLYLTLGLAFLTLISALGMHEPSQSNHTNEPSPSIKAAFGHTLTAGLWILRTPFALAVILAGLIFDSIARMVITLSSQYYRLIELPEAIFGLIGALVAGLGLFIPRLALWLSQKCSPAINFSITAMVSLTGLVGMTFFWPLIGLLPALILFGGMQMTSFFVSHYLNQVTDSAQRATVLSFKGLSFNLAYGLIGVLYARLIVALKPRIANQMAPDAGESLQGEVFIAALQWFPWTLLIAIASFAMLAGWLYYRKGVNQ